MGKMSQNASSLKPHGQLKPNYPGMIIGRSSIKFLFFMSIGTFKHFPIGSNVNLFPAVVAILDFRSAYKNLDFVEDLPMIILGQFGFREEAF
jgi:hypothetical protein